jgi:methyl-accepting chemotaxis protein
LDIGRFASFHITDEDKAAIRYINKVTSTSESPPLDRIATGETRTLLPIPTIEKIHRTPEFISLSQMLRRIKLATSDGVISLPKHIPQVVENAKEPVIKYAYIVANIPESYNPNVVKFIADADYELHDENNDGVIEYTELGSTAGMLYHAGGSPQLLNAFHGLATADKDYTTDQWGTFISAYFPIIDANGYTIAVLGLDMDATGNFNLLKDMRKQFLYIVFASVIIATLLSLLISLTLTRRLRIIQKSADDMRNLSSTKPVRVSGNDEISQLAESFNNMIRDIKEYYKTVDRT